MPDCSASEHRQFDFWIGHWTVTADGKAVGESHVESILEGCAVLETWTGASGTSGKSLNLFNRQLGAWEQFWVDSHGERLWLRGARNGDAMVMEGGEGARRDRITWTRQSDTALRQVWEVSEDGGATWRVDFDGQYARTMDVDRVD